MHRFLPVAFVFLLVWTGCENESGPVGPEPDPILDEAAATITASEVAEGVGIIAHDSMGGRRTPSPGLEATASYIASRFQAAGLEAAGTEGYFQRFSFTYHVRDVGSLLLELTAGGGPALEHGSDYLLLGSAAERGDAEGPMLWGGPASAPGAGGLDKVGRVVLYDLPVSQFDLDAILSTIDAADAVVQAGGVAVGFVVGPDFSEEDVARAVARSDRYSRWIPEFWIRESAADSLLAAAGHDLAALRADGPRQLDDSLRVRGVLTEVTAAPPNVVGLLRGSDASLSNEYVVATAHFDHIGIGIPDATGDSIRNGADDNASGTVAVLELAEAMASLETPPARSVLFLLVSGEEQGLLGSAHFAQHPTVPMSGIVANLNLDMVGRNDPAEVIGVGREFTSMGALADALTEQVEDLGITVIPDPVPSENLFFRSDQLVFACRDVPALFLHTGLHEDYHTLDDEVEDLNTDKIARVARLGLYLVHEIADTPQPPSWTTEGRAAVDQIQWCP